VPRAHFNTIKIFPGAEGGHGAAVSRSSLAPPMIRKAQPSKNSSTRSRSKG